MARMKGTQQQLRRRRDEEIAAAEGFVKRALTHRKDAQDNARRLQEKQWDAAFLALTDPDRARKIAEYHPYLERSMLRDLGIARDAEEKAEFHLAQARQCIARLDHRRYRERQPSGVLLLIRMCVLGWKRKRATQERRPLALHHLQ
jgi:hypothetical protein